jgi:predicted Zn-dependent protease
MRIELDIVPLDDIEDKIIDALKEELKERNFIVRVYAKMEVPKTSLNLYRKQYDADVIIDMLREMKGNIIALTNKDLYSKNLNFVFSMTEYDGPSVISLYRLNPTFYQEKSDFNLFVNRLVKEILYCIGKMKGLKDCGNVKCLMHKANSVRDLDYKEKDFCKDCKINNVLEGVDL